MSLNSINDYIAVLAPQYSTDPRLVDLVEIAKLNTSTQCFGDESSKKYMYAVALRVCHNLAIEEKSGGTGDGVSSGSGDAGILTQEKEGKLSKSFSQSSLNSNNTGTGFDYLNETAYGKKLIELIRGNCILPFTRLVGE